MTAHTRVLHIDADDSRTRTFAVVVHCGDNGPRAISERVDRALHATPLLRGSRTVTVSAGYATTTTPDASLGTLLAEADEAMYRNKAARASPDR